jgi:hypothetical protein
MLSLSSCPNQTPYSVSPASQHGFTARSVHTDTPLLQVRSRLLDLFHQLFVCFRDIVEREYAVSEFRQKVGAEGDESPEGYLWEVVRAIPMYEKSVRTYHGHNILLNLSWQRNKAEERAQV